MPANEDQLDRQFGFDLSSDAWMGRVRAALSEGVAPESSLSEHQPGDQIGNYELLDIVGKGGMGTVWKARRTDKRADRVVALKLIRSGMDSQTALRRFRLEEQVLARLEHPHIARLYDGGNSAGQPFFVMELVEGIPLNEFVRQRGLSVDERLTLYQNVCDAVHYAHSELVLHRDLKPGNILVTQDGDPKLLDFGIARILEHDHAVSAGITATDTRVLTPAYASPEQVRGERLSTSTDIYSLGVVLFELLTGVLPYEADRTSRHQLERAILEQEPIRPSTMVAQDTGLPQRVRKRLSRELRGDLDAICMKATARSPDQRYRSAQEMGEDVRRYLHGAPLLAKPPSTLAVMGRLIKRRRGVIGATTVGTALGLFAAALFVVSQFMVPRWQEEYITEARAAIVGAESNNNIGLYNVLYFSQLNPYDSPYDELQPSLQLAL
ncbi:MAG: serine/threonine protein kinase, partial [Phycisphaerae bacterium]